MKGHSKVGYYVVKGSQAASLKAYDIITTDCYMCATEYRPVYQTRRKQEAIELCNELNKIKSNRGYLAFNKNDYIRSKHYRFTFGGHLWEKDEHVFGFISDDCTRANNLINNLIEVIHRKNAEIKKLKRDLYYMESDYLQYKIIAEAYYEKTHHLNENQKFWEMLEDLGIDHTELCNKIRDMHKL